MAKRQAQQSLLPFVKKRIVEEDENAVLDERLSDSSTSEGQHHSVPFETHTQSPITATHEVSCSAQCCSNLETLFQPITSTELKSLATEKRNFQPQWYKQFRWLTICMTVQRAFCLYCRYASKHKLLMFSKMGEKAFTEVGFHNWKKGVEKFKLHEGSNAHKESLSKWMSRGKQSIAVQMSSQLQQSQQIRRNGLLAQIRAVRYLARQGLAFRNHDESEGNLHQLLLTWSVNNGDIESWLRNNRFTSHQAVNDILTIAGQSVLRNILQRIKGVNGPPWFSVIADEATDVASNEQMSVAIRWVDNSYNVREDPVGLFKVPNTTAETLFIIIKDILIRCNLPLSLCRGQAYDGAANMQGKRTGVATRLREEQPAAIPVHCFTHCLNLCLQDASRKLVYVRDALDTVREIGKLIRYSPKRLHLFSTSLQSSEEGGVMVKMLCPTRWTARTAAIHAILTDYNLLIETLEEIHQSTRDEYGMKAAGLQQALEKFNTLFTLKLCHLLFSAAEQLSVTLQTRSINIQDALAAVKATKAYYHRIRSDEAFSKLYADSIDIAKKYSINEPVLPRYRKRPSRYEDGNSRQHQYLSPKDYHRHQYFEACDLLSAELENRFESKTCSIVITIETTLLKAANGDDFEACVEELSSSHYKGDINFVDLKRHLLLLPDLIKQQLPTVKKVTLIDTICEAMNCRDAFKEMLPTVHQLLRLYLTLPITSATPERTFSALRRLMPYTRSQMTEKTLNNCFLLHVHKEFTDELDIILIAKEFIRNTDDRVAYFGNF